MSILKDTILDQIKGLLTNCIAPQLLDDLLKEFVLIKQDVVTGTLGRGSPGKFVETMVQIMQYLEKGQYDKQPAVDNYLKDIENRGTTLPDSLKLLVSRIARSIYSLRNKRGIGHKGEVDPNIMDLKYIFSGCQWILAELVRVYHVSHPDDAEKLIEVIGITPSVIIEDFGNFKTVLNRQIKPTDELLILLYSYYPSYVSVDQILKDMKRRAKKTVSGAIGALYKKAWIEGSKSDGYKLTSLGHRKAMKLIPKVAALQ
jgi:hypothetical protein